MKKGMKRVGWRIAGILLLFYMLSFASCDTVEICYVCENPHDPTQWQQVCNSMTKNKLESYGWVCTPF